MLFVRAVSVVLLAAIAPACIIEGWGGTGVARIPATAAAPAKSDQVWSLGASFGLYLDPQRTRYRLGVAAHADKSYVSVPELTSATMSGVSVRGDVILNARPESDRKLTRATVIASAGADDNAVDVEGRPYAADGTPVKLFVGITRSFGERESRNDYFSDSISYTLGAYGSRFPLPDDPMFGGTMTGAGGELRVTMAVSPVTVLRALGIAASAVNAAPTPTASSSSGTKPNSPPACVPVRTCRKDSMGALDCQVTGC